MAQQCGKWKTKRLKNSPQIYSSSWFFSGWVSLLFKSPLNNYLQTPPFSFTLYWCQTLWKSCFCQELTLAFRYLLFEDLIVSCLLRVHNYLIIRKNDPLTDNCHLESTKLWPQRCQWHRGTNQDQKVRQTCELVLRDPLSCLVLFLACKQNFKFHLTHLLPFWLQYLHCQDS